MAQQWRKAGSFTYLKDKPKFIHFDEGGDFVAARLRVAGPGVARITFHDAMPEVINNAQGVDLDVFRQVPPINIFTLILLRDNAGMGPEVVQPVNLPGGISAYNVLWTGSYQININDGPRVQLHKQQQSAIFKRPEPVGQVGEGGDEGGDEGEGGGGGEA